MARLQLVSENGDPTTVALKDRPVAIGRHPENDVVLKDDLASRFHCVIEPDGSGSYCVRDLGSRNGTRVNDELVNKASLRPGDVLRVGSHSFRVEGEAPRSKPKGGGLKGVEGGERWAVELAQMMDELPPRGKLESIKLIDARGDESDALDSGGGGSLAIRLLLLTASKSRATDIHFEPKPDALAVRMRVDGVMVAIVKLPAEIGELAMGLIKNVCHMKQAARDAVLEGHFASQLDLRRVDYRASFTPSIHGQKLVIRVLDVRDTPHSLAELGMASYMLEKVARFCEQNAGMLLVCGPTGSGKTTTLYNCMRDIDVDRRNVITIEDPVEYSLKGVTQIPADHGKGNTFGSLLRSVLRQDPDVILVGEIRDGETARTALQAAMTGHLVFSTVHAKDTVGSVFRLLDLGVEPYLVANSLSLVVAQRLVRVLCDDCKRPVRVTPGQATRMGRFAEGKTEVFTATGCSRCLRTGYRGRRAVFELLEFNDELRDVVLNEPSIAAMKKVIAQGLFTTLEQSGWQLASRGITSLEEVDQVVGGS